MLIKQPAKHIMKVWNVMNNDRLQALRELEWKMPFRMPDMNSPILIVKKKVTNDVGCCII